VAPPVGSPRTIGLLGGMSAESSIEYERLINAEIRRALGGSHSGSLLVRSYDFAVIETLQSRGAWEEAGALLARDARQLQAAGAELVVLCTNTMHRVAPAIEAAIDVPFLHLADTTAAAVRAAGLHHVGLLGTRFTMEGDFYRDRLAAGGVTTLVPDEPDRSLVHHVIYDELVQGILDPASRSRIVAVIGRLAARGAQGVIAGCTEIEMLVTTDDVSVPYFPTTQLHAVAAARWSLGESVLDEQHAGAS
jgi:aspartate racemase